MREAFKNLSIIHIPKVDSTWKRSDYFGALKVRSSIGRRRYTVKPGLYKLGSPTNQSDVLISANYKLSFDVLRRAMKGLHAWVLVLDTRGINVWCAAGKGTFGTDELIRQIQVSNLDHYVSHKRLIVPQLGAPGIAAHVVKQKQASM